MSALDKIKDVMTAKELLDLDVTEFPWLVENLIPKIGIGALVGESETGKSTFLRQFALSVAEGKNTFLDFKLKTSSKNAIYVSTEDGQMPTAYWFKRQFQNTQKEGKVNSESLNRLEFIFDSSNLLETLETKLKASDIDLIIIDAFADIFTEDINATNKVRRFLNAFDKLAKDHKCFILFLHHYGKSNKSSKKDRVLGSQGFEGKVRVLLSLDKDKDGANLHILKHNYLSNEQKENKYPLRMTDTQTFRSNGSALADTTKAKKKTRTKVEQIIEDHEEKLCKYIDGDITAEELKDHLSNLGFNVSVGTIQKAKKEYLKKKS